jgi:SPOR domain
MSMARDGNFRPRRDEPHGDSAPTTGGRGNDPLAELARLIGQDDPLAAVGRQGRGSSRASTAEPRDHDPQDAREWAAHQTEDGPGQHGRSARADSADDPHHYDAGAYQGSQYQDDRGYETGESQGAYASGAYYDDGQAAYGDEGYDEPHPEKRRGGIMTIAAVVGVAVIATVGIFGYRGWTSPSTTGGDPPVIKAEQAPTKVIPAAPSTDSQPSKLAYDRIGDRGGERVVPREEQPIDPRSAVRMPAPSSSGAPISTGSVLPPLPAQAPSAAMTGAEPKKVKTETIRPNQNAAPATAPANPPQRIANVAPPAPAPSTRSIAPTAPATSTPATPSPPQRTAMAPEATGGYVVQVASQRSESDAQASFRALQQKYPSVLGSHQVMVRRADLGDKGVYYRAQVGPFATAEEAWEMCTSLKSAGGQCIVQRN